MIDTSVRLAGLKPENPFMTASGVLGSSSSLMIRALKAGAGAIVTKTFTPNPREGYEPPVVYSERCYTLNAIGLSNPGMEKIAETIKPILKMGAPVIVSVAGGSVEEFVEISVKAMNAGAHGIELNLSCPHVKGLGADLGSDPDMVYKVVRAVKDVVDIPVFAKLSPNVNDITGPGRAAVKGGADALVAINTVRGMVIDVELKAPVLTNIYGGVSGRAIHPIAVYMVFRLYTTFDVPIVGVGGVETWRDAVELMLAGATAVQVGTAIKNRGFKIFRSLIRGLKSYMKRHGYRSVEEIVGAAIRR